MNNSDHREKLEADLKKQIRSAEKEAINDPKLKSMIKQLRDIYHSDKDSFLFMLGVAPPPSSTNSQNKPKNIPTSKIPQLLLMLDALATKKPLPVLPAKKPGLDGMPNPILSTLPHPAENEVDYEIHSPLDEAHQEIRPPDIDSNSPPDMDSNSEENQKEIEELEVEIRKARALYDLIKKDEMVIRQRKGKYGVPIERLKAERLLRELPEQIRHMIHKKRLLQGLD